MDSVIIASLVAGGFAVFSPLVTYAATRHFNDRDKVTISRERRKVLNAKWRGSVIQRNRGKQRVRSRLIAIISRRDPFFVLKYAYALIAVAVIGGMISSSFLTLVVPALYFL